MIAKSIARKTKGQGFKGLARYVANEGKMAAVPGGWGATATYIADEGRSGAKVAPGSVRLTNCASETLGEAEREIELTQARARQGKAERTYHLVVAFPAGEVPTREQLEDIEDELVKAIGLGDHQRLSAIHTDKDHLHFHVAVNKVHPVTFRTVTPHQDKNKLMRACARLEVKHGLTRTHGERVQGADGAATAGRAADMEAHSGQESLLRWARETAKADLLAASAVGKGWRDLHDAAALHGLEVRQRGAGVVFGVPGKPKLSVKASDVDRELSAKALTGRLGPFQADTKTRDKAQGHGGARRAPDSGRPPGSYERRPKDRDATADELMARYRVDREEKQKARAAGLDEVRARHARYRAELRQEGADRRLHSRQYGTTPRRREVEREERRVQMRQSIDAAAAEREAVRKRSRTPTWYGFLQGEAEAGNEKALRLLRQVERRRVEIAMNLLHAADLSEGRAIVMKGIDKHVSKDGTVNYRTQDGGTVQDRKRGVGVAEVTASSALLALIVAAERFDRPLKVTGTDEFKRAVAVAAATPGVNVRFEDPAMEEMRAEAVQAREEARKRGPDKPTFLIVPFKDRDEARARGAEWDRERKEWFVPAGIDPDRLGLGEWVPGNGRFSRERTHLDVPMGAHNQARGRGASYDSARKQWFVGPEYDLARVRDWISQPERTKPERRSAAADFVAARNEAASLISTIQNHKVWDSGDAGPGTFRGYAELRDGARALLVEKEGKILVVAKAPDQHKTHDGLMAGQAVMVDRNGDVSASRSQGRGR